MKAAALAFFAFCCLVTPALGSEAPTLSESLAAELFVTESSTSSGEDCEATLDLEAVVGMPDPTYAAINCGACSTSNCVGRPRGSMCHLGPIIGGWGWCNIYSGGYMCSTGGWECSCGTGPLP